MMGQMGFDSVALMKYPMVERIHHVHHAGNASGIVDGAALVLIGSNQRATNSASNRDAYRVGGAVRHRNRSSCSPARRGGKSTGQGAPEAAGRYRSV